MPITWNSSMRMSVCMAMGVAMSMIRMSVARFTVSVLMRVSMVVPVVLMPRTAHTIMCMPVPRARDASVRMPMPVPVLTIEILGTHNSSIVIHWRIN